MKMRFTVSIGLCLLLMLSACGTVDNWVLGKDNTPPPAPLEKFTPTLTLHQLWSVHAGDGTGQIPLRMDPVKINDLIYVADHKGSIMAIEAKNGKKRWVQDLDMTLVSGPAVFGNHLVVCNDEAQVVMMSSKTGKKLWQNNVSNVVFAPPQIWNNKVYAKTVDGKIYAFAVDLGTELWVYDHGSSGLALRSGSAPLVERGFLMAGFSDGKLDGLNAESGQLLWQRVMAVGEGGSEVERLVDIDADPVQSDGVLYVVTYQGYLVAMSLQTGEILWRHPLSSYSGIAIRGNTLFITDLLSNVWAFNKQTGAVLWKQEALARRGLTAPRVSSNALVVADALGYVHWLSLEDGHFLGQLRVAKAPIYVPPIVSDSHVYVMGSNGVLTHLVSSPM